jgi:uncharacterized membrane protein
VTSSLEENMLNAQEPKPNSRLGLDRIISFSDAVIAVAITLMVVQVQMPESVAADQLPQALRELIPTFTSYVFSFYMVAVYWIEHHRMFKYIKRYDDALIWLNLLLLMLIAVVPFATNLLDTYTSEQIVVFIYAALIAAVGLLTMGMWWYATHRHRLVDKDLCPLVIRKGLVVRLVAPVVFIVSIGIAIFSVPAAMYSWFAIIPLVIITHRIV